MRVDTARVIYKRKQLGQALEGIWEYPLTVVEAPMGYGKTKRRPSRSCEI